MSGVQAGGRGGVSHLYVVAIKKQFMAAAGFSLRLHRRDACATN